MPYRSTWRQHELDVQCEYNGQELGVEHVREES